MLNDIIFLLVLIWCIIGGCIALLDLIGGLENYRAIRKKHKLCLYVFILSPLTWGSYITYKWIVLPISVAIPNFFEWLKK